MISLGWKADKVTEFINLMHTHHNINIAVRLLDTSHNYLGDLSDRFIDGQITVDAAATNADRALDLTLLDPTRAIQFDPDAPSGGSVYINHMISVIYSITTPAGDKTFDVPVFCGPINKVERNGVMLDIKCLGKEVMSSDGLWVGRTYKKNVLKTAMIRDLLARAGESTSKMSIPTRPTRNPSNVSYGHDHKPWSVAKSLANSMGCQLFYDGRGVVVMRPHPSKSVITFGEHNVTVKPQFGFDLTTVRNAVHVTGGIPKGSKKRIQYRKVAPDSHPLSPYALRRNGVRRYVNPIVINDSKIRTYAEAKRRGDYALNAALLESVDATLDILPNVLIEPNDIAYLSQPEASMNIRLSKFTIPLIAGDDTSIGYLRRLKPRGGRRMIVPRRV